MKMERKRLPHTHASAAESDEIFMGGDFGHESEKKALSLADER